MKNIKVSVIIPIYMVEKYIKQCVDSVLEQTYKNIEVILIDDGSLDQCPYICDQYSEKDDRIVVFHKENGGLSDARNYGIKYATGDYGIFIDSDDFWTRKDALEKLVERVEQKNVDIVNFLYHKYKEDTEEYINSFCAVESMPIVIQTKAGQLKYLFAHSLYIASACNKMIKMSLLKKVEFEYGKVSEDVEWCAKLLAFSNSLDFINLDMYCYRQRQESITQSISEKNCIDLKDVITNCIRLAKECENEIKPFLNEYAAYQFSTFIAVQAYSKKYPLECIKQLNLEKRILKYYGNNRKVRCMYYGSKFLGLSLWCRLIRLTKPIWGNRRDII